MEGLKSREELEGEGAEGGGVKGGGYGCVGVLDGLVRLSGDLAGGGGSPTPADDDARNGVTIGSGATPFPTGATAATITNQPATVERLAQAGLSWQGAALGADMPLGRPFVTVQRLDHGSWTHVSDDLGLHVD